MDDHCGLPKSLKKYKDEPRVIHLTPDEGSQVQVAHGLGGVDPVVEVCRVALPSGCQASRD